MSKRRRKGNNKPNLPDDVLARARRNAGIEEEPETEDVADSTDDGAVSDSAVDASTVDAVSVSERAARRRKLSGVQLERSRKRGELSNEMIADVLHNPTLVVTEEDLREDYQHVIYDLRNMGILAVILVVVLVGLAFNLPTF